MSGYKAILLYNIETFLMLYVGIQIFKLKVSKWRIFATMIVYGMSIYTVRGVYEYFGIPFGTHTIILLILFILYSIFICRIPMIQAISTGYIGYTLQVIGEWLITVPIINAIDGMVDQAFFDSWKGILIGLTAYTVLILVALCLWISRRKK